MRLSLATTRRGAWALVFCTLLSVPFSAIAQTPTQAPPKLNEMSIEDLMRIEVTSASRKAQLTEDVASPVFVITHDDIRRSGMTTIPDLLRLAPGVQVAQINSNKWAVSVRGFNGLYANKLLVLVDGRSIYTRIYSGVLWDAENLMVDDIDRIEVIRGPGAAVWGANAVNAVINIVTKSAADTQGGFVRVQGGRAGTLGAVRYGGTLGATKYRLFAQWTGRDESLIAPGARADDRSHGISVGFRADRVTKANTLILEGAYTFGKTRALWSNLDPQTAAIEPVRHEPSTSKGVHVLGRWRRTLTGGGSIQIQSFIDLVGRDEPVGDYRRHAFDIDTQYHATFGTRHDVVAGIGYRFVGERLAARIGVSLTPPDDDSALGTAFVQDEIAFFGRRLAVTLGTQVQHDAYAGGGVQPTARLMWKGLPRQRLWAGVSRALRTPSLGDRGLQLDLPPTVSASGLPVYVSLRGSPAAKTETLVDAEAGYRLEFGSSASIDLTTFAGRYARLRTNEVGAPVFQPLPSPRILVNTTVGNLLSATTRGLEIAGHWTPLAVWRLDGSVTTFRLAPTLEAGSLDPLAAGGDGNAPRVSWQVRSAFELGPRGTVDVAIFHVGALRREQVAAYTRADLNAEWRFSRRLSVTAAGQNLFQAAHTEFSTADSLVQATQVPRQASVGLRWTFR